MMADNEPKTVLTPAQEELLSKVLKVQEEFKISDIANYRNLECVDKISESDPRLELDPSLERKEHLEALDSFQKAETVRIITGDPTSIENGRRQKEILYNAKTGRLRFYAKLERSIRLLVDAPDTSLGKVCEHLRSMLDLPQQAFSSLLDINIKDYARFEKGSALNSGHVRFRIIHIALALTLRKGGKDIIKKLAGLKQKRCKYYRVSYRGNDFECEFEGALMLLLLDVNAYSVFGESTFNIEPV